MRTVDGIDIHMSPHMPEGRWIALDAAGEMIYFGSIDRDSSAPLGTRKIIVAPDLFAAFKELPLA